MISIMENVELILTTCINRINETLLIGGTKSRLDEYTKYLVRFL